MTLLAGGRDPAAAAADPAIAVEVMDRAVRASRRGTFVVLHAGTLLAIGGGAAEKVLGGALRDGKRQVAILAAEATLVLLLVALPGHPVHGR